MKNPLYLLASLLLFTAACSESRKPAEAPQRLFVQSSDGAVLTDSTLTLTGVNPRTGWFTDRPYRSAGLISTEEFVSLWGEGQDPFIYDSPNADFTCTIDGEVVNYAVELFSPRLEGDELTYRTRAIGGGAVLPQASECDSDSHLFVDAGGFSDYCETDSDCDSGLSCYLPFDGSMCAYAMGSTGLFGVEEIGPSCTTDADCDGFKEDLSKYPSTYPGWEGVACYPAYMFCNEMSGAESFFSQCTCQGNGDCGS